MPVSSFMGLQTALSAIVAQQRALDVASHNIANAGTEGYTRQSVEYAAAPSMRLPGATNTGTVGWLGQGVNIDEFRRVRDTFLDVQYRAQHTTASHDETQAKGVRRALDELGEPGDNGINALLDRFWNSWHDLANSPSDRSVMSAVLGHATTLANAINGLDGRLARIQNAAGDEYATLTTGPQNPIGPIAEEIARLNAQIKRAVAVNQAPNELSDRRDLLLDRLAEYGTVALTENGDGSVDVQFGDAATLLVDDATAAWPQALTAPGGKLGALLGVQSTMAAYRSDLDAFAQSIATAVNGAHSTDGAPPFFAGTNAASLSVSATMSTLDTGTGTSAGANDIARAIAALGNGASDQLYATLVSRIGHDANVAETVATSSMALRDTIAGRRQSVAGVSLDEEMANMIRFQRSYQAAARTMSAMDEMLDTIINRTGRVGL